MRWVWVWALSLAIGGLGCSAAQPKIGSVTLAEASGEKPGWINKVPEDGDGTLFWVGRKTGSESQDGALRDAREDVFQQVAEYLQNTSNKLYERVRTERAAREDLGPARAYVNDLFRSWHKAVKTSGLKEREIYNERWEKVQSVERVTYDWRGYVLMGVDKKKLAALGHAALAEQLDKAREKADTEAAKALEGMEPLLDDLEK